MTPGERIKKLRKEKGMTQKELAKKLGFSPSQLGQYENGYRNPKPSTVKKIADALEVPVSKITGMIPEEDETEKILSNILAIQKELEKIGKYLNCLSVNLEKYYLYRSKDLSNLNRKLSNKKLFGIEE